MFALKIFGGHTTRFVVCASKPWPVTTGRSCKNLMGQRPSAPKGPKYSLPKKVQLGGSTCARITIWFVDQSSPNSFRPIGNEM